MKHLNPKSHAEAVAIFRQSIIGHLIHRELLRGELRAELLKLSKQYFRPPGSDITRTFGVSTLEGWYYDSKNRGLAGLEPKGRAKGHANAIPEAAKELLLAIRREHRSASAALIRRTLIEEGRPFPALGVRVEPGAPEKRERLLRYVTRPRVVKKFMRPCGGRVSAIHRSFRRIVPFPNLIASSTTGKEGHCPRGRPESGRNPGSFRSVGGVVEGGLNWPQEL